MTAEQVLQEFVVEQGWNGASCVALLCAFVDEQKAAKALSAFLAAQQEEENAETTEDDEEDEDE